jgi:hypothetical protein
MRPASRRLKIPPYQGEIAPAFDFPGFRDWLGAIEDRVGDADAEILQAGRNTVAAVCVKAERGRSLQIVIKDFRLRGLTRLKTLLVASKARRAWQGAFALQGAGLLTAGPIAYLEKRRAGTVERAFFLAERLPEGVEIRALFRDRTADDLPTVLGQLAGVVRCGHDRGIVHRDLSDGNVLVAGGPDGPRRFYFLDTNRVRRKRRIGNFARARSLIRLGIPAELRRDFLEAYAGKDGLRPSFVRSYNGIKSLFEGWLRFKKRAHLRRWARRLKLQ